MAVSQPSSGPRLLRFGVFEVDLAARELRKNGARIRLQEQPLQVLVTLLENAGRIVTRDDLRQKIWAADTFVDFDHSVNTAVNKIREALGDSASSPRFVETLARRGYRFIAPVNEVDVLGAASSSEIGNGNLAVAQPNRIAESPNISEPALHPELNVPIPHRGLVRVLFSLIQIMYLAFYVIALYHLQGVDRVAGAALPDRGALVIVIAVLVTAAACIPLRFYLLSAVAFDFQKLGDNFRRLFPFILVLDQLWAIAPFLLWPQIGIGLALGATATLLYVPFAERTLVRMGYWT